MSVIAKGIVYRLSDDDIAKSELLTIHYEESEYDNSRLDEPFPVNFEPEEFEFYLDHSRSLHVKNLSGPGLIQLMQIANFFGNEELLNSCAERIGSLARENFSLEFLDGPIR